MIVCWSGIHLNLNCLQVEISSPIYLVLLFHALWRTPLILHEISCSDSYTVLHSWSFCILYLLLHSWSFLYLPLSHSLNLSHTLNCFNQVVSPSSPFQPLFLSLTSTFLSLLSHCLSPGTPSFAPPPIPPFLPFLLSLSPSPSDFICWNNYNFDVSPPTPRPNTPSFADSVFHFFAFAAEPRLLDDFQRTGFNFVIRQALRGFRRFT